MPGGRPRKTDEQKKREGTFRKDRAAPTSVQFSALTKIPPAPKSFDDVAKNVWNTICGELVNLGLMQNIDIFQVEIICKELSIYWKCIEKMGSNFTVDTGTGSNKVNPLYTAACSALNNFNRLSAQFGFSPAARMKIRANIQDAKPKENKALTLIQRKKLLK